MKSLYHKFAVSEFILFTLITLGAVLSGVPYAVSAQSIAPPPSSISRTSACTLTDGSTMQNGEYRLFYSASSVVSPASCSSVSSYWTCYYGYLFGDPKYNKPSCTVVDGTAPQVSLTAPAAGATVSGTVAVSADATDATGVLGVRFSLDGKLIGAEDTSAPYTINWDSKTVVNGAHTLAATARDAAGNRATSTRSVTVSNIVGISTTTQQWRVAEITLTSSTTYQNAYTDVEIDATFTGPGGVVITRPAFWDGGNTWKIRFAPTKVGTWTFTTVVSSTTATTRDTGLSGITGTVVATPYTGSLPIYQKGFVKSRPGRYLVYDDNTPFWWIGYEMFWAIDTGRLNESNKTVWNPPVAHPNSQILGSLDRAVSQQFNATSYAFNRHLTYKTVDGIYHVIPDILKISELQKLYDPVIAYTADQGLTMNLSVALGEFGFMPADSLKRMGRYFVARYGAYPVVWNVSEPDMPVGWHESHTPPVPADNAKNMGDMLAYIASIDAYHHPIAPYYLDTIYPMPRKRPELYLDTNWIGLIEHQCGSLPNTGTQPIASYEFYYNKYPTIPMVEIGCNYPDFNPIVGGDNVARRSAWRAVQAGSAGFHFGIFNVFTMNWDKTGTTTRSNQVPWHTVIESPSGWQMQWLTKLYTALPWHTMVPRTSGANTMVAQISGPVPVDDISQPLVRADMNADNVVVYFPAEFPAASVLHLKSLAPYLYTARWYDPQTGAFTLISASVTPLSGQWPVPQKPNGNDWVLLLQKSSTPVPPIPQPEHLPIGNLEFASGQYVQGWAFDPDATSTSIQVAVFIDGPYKTGTLIGYAMANLSRPDVNAVRNINGNHGFSFRVPAQYATGPHSVYVYGMGISQGNNVLLSSVPKTY